MLQDSGVDGKLCSPNLAAVEMPLSSTFSTAAGATELLRGWKVASSSKRWNCLRSLMLRSGALAAEDLRWLWGPRTAIIGSADYDLLIGEAPGLLS